MQLCLDAHVLFKQATERAGGGDLGVVVVVEVVEVVVVDWWWMFRPPRQWSERVGWKARGGSSVRFDLEP